MKYKITGTIFGSIFLVIFLERAMGNIGVAQACSLIPFLPPLLPCSTWNFFTIVFIVVFVIENFVLPIFIKSKDVKLNISQYHSPQYLQSKVVGVVVENQSDYDIFPKVKFLGDIRCTEYSEGGNEKSYRIKLRKNSRLVDSGILVGVEDTNPIALAKVENNKNISLQTSSPFLLNSSFSFGDNAQDVKVAKWDFNFKIVGKIKKSKFETGVYSSSIEAFIRPYRDHSNSELFVQMGDVVKL